MVYARDISMVNEVTFGLLLCKKGILGVRQQL